MKRNFFLIFILISCFHKKNSLTIIGENSSAIQSMQALQTEYEKNSGVRLDFKPSSFGVAFTKSKNTVVNSTERSSIQEETTPKSIARKIS